MFAGGALTSALSWSSIFFINVPAGILVIAVSPWLLRESRAESRAPQLRRRRCGDDHERADAPRVRDDACRAARGCAEAQRSGLLAASGRCIAAFFVVELRSKAPLLPLRIVRLRTLTASGTMSGLLMGGAIFSQFFLLTLYMQEVLPTTRRSRPACAYIGLTLTIIAFSAASQALVTRLGVRWVLPVELALSAVALVLFARLPVDGHYSPDLFPAFIIGGVGLALAFVPMSIGALTGVQQADAGIASGLINTSQQIGGAVGVALATTIATTFTAHYVSDDAGSNAFGAAALTHGFGIAFYVLAGLAALGAVLSAVMLEAKPAPEAAFDAEAVEFEAAA